MAYPHQFGDVGRDDDRDHVPRTQNDSRREEEDGGRVVRLMLGTLDLELLSNRGARQEQEGDGGAFDSRRDHDHGRDSADQGDADHAGDVQLRTTWQIAHGAHAAGAWTRGSGCCCWRCRSAAIAGRASKSGPAVTRIVHVPASSATTSMGPEIQAMMRSAASSSGWNRPEAINDSCRASHRTPASNNRLRRMNAHAAASADTN